MEQKRQALEGTVEYVTFTSEQTGFSVFSLDIGGELVTVVGDTPGIATGEVVVVTGYYTSHPTYGQQFRAELCERMLPATAAAIRKYLASGVIKGIGERMAARIVDKFGDETLTVIETSPAELATVYGISLKKAHDISEQYKHIFGIRAVMLDLARLGLDASDSIRIWKHWGTLATQVITENPYALCCEAVAVPFAQADALALKEGVEPTDPRRHKAGILHVLSHNLNNGHTCLPQDKLLLTAARLLETEFELLEDALEQAIEDRDAVRETHGGAVFISLPVLYEAETYIAGRIELMLQSTCPEKKSYAGEIENLEQQLGISYAPLQRKAIEMALQNNIFILTGGPGTGKTTALNAILELLEQAGERVSLAAPTGRAAKRMSEVTGRESKTIHRLLEVDFRDSDGLHRFKRDQKNPLRSDTVILDEVSMVDTRLLYSLIKALRLNCRLILVGDPDQLPSVGAGNVLRDLLDSDMIPSIRLTEIFRQARESAIVSGAHLIVRGDYPDLSVRNSDFFFMQRESYQATARTVLELCTQRLPTAYGFSPIQDIQVITPSRIGALGTVELNRLLQEKLNPSDGSLPEYRFGPVTFREGDKVMQVKNNYDVPWQRDDAEPGAGVYNGDIGMIEMIDRPSQTIMIRYDDKIARYSFDMAGEIEHAWAITVHKSQGSEFEAVVMPLMNFHQKLYYRNILYTAVTRAKKIMIMIGREETVYRMVDNDRKVLRYTGLCTYLCAMNAGKADER